MYEATNPEITIIDSNGAIKQQALDVSRTQGMVGEYYNGIPKPDFEKIFPEVDVQSISLKDFFMRYEPQTRMEQRVKSSIIEAKKQEMPNFHRPAMDPSFSDDDKTIIYVKGGKPAVGKPAVWWDQVFRNFMPSRHSRSGTQMQYDVYLGTIIKYLVEEKKYLITDAWHMVCLDSKELGHYYNSTNSNHYEYEPTGSRKVEKWYDLANVCKIIKKDEGNSFAMVSGNCDVSSKYRPLAFTLPVFDPWRAYYDSVGWLVFD